MAMRAEKKALSLGLGDAVMVAKKIAATKRELSKEFRMSPLKGVVKQSTVQKRIDKRNEEQRKLAERLYNPKIKGLRNVPGVTVDEKGEVSWQELKKQVPGIERMKKMHIPGVLSKAERIRRAKENRGKDDDYQH
jgi:hypothetical protein